LIFIFLISRVFLPPLHFQSVIESTHAHWLALVAAPTTSTPAEDTAPAAAEGFYTTLAYDRILASVAHLTEPSYF
jgi:hypothetical protein